MKNKRIYLLMLCCLLMIVLVACSGDTETTEAPETPETPETETPETSAAEGGTMSIPINSDTLKFINPIETYGSDDQLIALSPCFDPLFIVTKDETRWYLADSLTMTNEEGTEYELKLKDNLKWHDGESITADDVVFSVLAYQDPSNTSDASYVRYDGKDIVTEKIDDLTVKVTLEEPFSAFETEFGRLMIFPEHEFDSETSNVKENTEALNRGIGSGPFKLKEFNPGDSVVYERNEDYYRGQAPLEQVIIKTMPDAAAQEAALQSGELSMMRVTSDIKLESYENDDRFNIFNIPEGRLNYMTFNYQSPKMKDINVRKAISLALNPDEIIQGGYGSTDLAIPAKNFMAPQNLYYNEEMEGPKQDIEEAKRLAEETGLVDETLVYIYNQNRPNMQETAQVVQQNLEAIGVKVELQGLDSPAFFPKLFAAWLTGETVVDTSWDLATNGMDQLNADPASKMTSWTGELAEAGFYVSPKTKELWKDASTSIEEDKKEELYKELQISMNEDYSLYPMANTNYVMVADKRFIGLDEIERVPIFEDYLKISMTE